MARVLLVDENATVLLSNAMLLKGDGHHVIEAESELEALELFLAGKPDIVVTALNMPERGGMSLIDEIRKTDGRTPIVLMGGLGNSCKQFSLATTKGVNVCLSAPFIPSRLVGAVNGLLHMKVSKR